MVDVPKLLKRNREKVQRCLMEFLPVTHEHPNLQAFYTMMWDYPLRASKGLRSTLCLLICEAFGGKPHLAIRTAAAIELFQNWILIHDDIEDASDLRRGEPCLHHKYGIPMAINAGDALHNQMWCLLHQNVEDLGYECSFQVLHEFTELVSTVAAGQHIELSWVAQDTWDLSEEDYYLMCERKTASYTCVSPCRLGALIAGASKREINAFREIGRTLGIAFQLQDDLLNLTADEGKYGKEIAGDLWEGKRTLILIHLLRRSSQIEKERIQAILSEPRTMKQESDILWILDQMHSHGSTEYARTHAQRLVQFSKQLFNEQFPRLPNSQAREAFLDVVDFVIEREY